MEPVSEVPPPLPYYYQFAYFLVPRRLTQEQAEDLLRVWTQDKPDPELARSASWFAWCRVPARSMEDEYEVHMKGFIAGDTQYDLHTLPHIGDDQQLFSVGSPRVLSETEEKGFRDKLERTFEITEAKIGWYDSYLNIQGRPYTEESKDSYLWSRAA